MRAVALSDKEIQDYVTEHFVPLKVAMEPGSKEVPVDWLGLLGWRLAYQVMGGPQCNGFTGCLVVSSDLSTNYGSTGSAAIWEMFDSIAYDRDKFLAMLKEAQALHRKEQAIRSDSRLSPHQRRQRLGQFRAGVVRESLASPKKREVPEGFTWFHALELFRQSGDIP